MAGSGAPDCKQGLTIAHYSFEHDMTSQKIAMYSSDGDFLIVPQTGTLLVATEFGKLRVPPKEIIVIPRGCKFSIDVEGKKPARGWLAELFKGHFVIPDLGPIGANGLANERDFEAPVAAYEN